MTDGAANTTPTPPAPVRADPATFPDDRRDLHEGVRAALSALPAYFSFPSPLHGIQAADLHSLSNLMGAAIEDQVVQALNGLRNVWDQDNQWSEYAFVRSAQAFPDVRLARRTDAGMESVFGIELKGWFLLAREGVPSLRYQVSPDACAPWDLVCVVPWHLDSVVAGQPRVIQPWVEQAKYAALWRDHWWEFLRGGNDTAAERKIIPPAAASPYPSKADLVSMKPVKDNGGNYGRLPRCKPLMDSFISGAMETPLLGIPAVDWQQFFKVHTENADPTEVLRAILRMNPHTDADIEDEAERLLALLREVAANFDLD